MFVKFIYNQVKKKEDGMILERNKISGYPIEHVYDVNHFSLFPSIGENGIDMSDEMNLSLEFNKSGPEGWDKTISFPVEQKDQIIEIFIMNEHGKTIDRHIY